LAGSGDCIKILDLDGRLQFMSEGGKRVMEVEDFGALKGCPWPDFWSGAGNADAVAAVEAARTGRTTRFRGLANTAKGNLRYWDVHVAPILGSDSRPSHIISISRDVTEQWKASQRERFLIDELEHRAKNSFAVVLSIANQTFRGSEHAAALEIYKARIMMLAKAHALGKESNWTSTPVGRVIEDSLASYRTGEGRIKISGPDFKISPKQALALTLALNELATNASKYGALSSTAGRVDISWSVSGGDDPEFVWLWQEYGGPPVCTPSRLGFGTRLIKELLANDFGGSVQLSYELTGVVCELKAPLKNSPT
jgi:two-component sensor histidine kinase